MSEILVARTVCHGCRQVTHVRDDDGNLRPMSIPGPGTILIDKAPGMLAELPCPVCGSGDDVGWVPGLVPPV